MHYPEQNQKKGSLILPDSLPHSSDSQLAVSTAKESRQEVGIAFQTATFDSDSNRLFQCLGPNRRRSHQKDLVRMTDI